MSGHLFHRILHYRANKQSVTLWPVTILSGLYCEDREVEGKGIFQVEVDNNRKQEKQATQAQESALSTSTSPKRMQMKEVCSGEMPVELRTKSGHHLPFAKVGRQVHYTVKLLPKSLSEQQREATFQ